MISIWQDDRCQATFRLDQKDVADLIGELARMLVPPHAARSNRRAG